MKVYGPDGGYPEGYNYWGYGTGFTVMMISALEKVFQTDFGLRNYPGFMKTAQFRQNLVGPSGKAFNFSDAREASEPSASMILLCCGLKKIISSAKAIRICLSIVFYQQC
jgi:hypothetical protein